MQKEKDIRQAEERVLSQQQILDEKQRAKNLEHYLLNERKKYREAEREPKLLILGSSDAGKSTFLKQLKILHGSGFTDQEITAAKQNAIQQVITVSELILQNGDDNIKSKYSGISQFLNLSEGPYDALPLAVIKCMSKLWEDPDVQCLCKELKHLIPESSDKFFKNIRNIGSIEYRMTNEEILLLRVVTQVISETIFQVKNVNFHFYDVSGLTHHRKHWIPYFEHVLGVIFLVDISAYDRNLAENPEVNRLVDALNLFNEIVNHKLLANASMMLFFNKKDLFEVKTSEVYIKDYFPDYTGRVGSASDGGRYFHKKFFDLIKNKSKTVDAHFTCCTDTNLIKKVSDNLLESVIQISLKRSELV
ncbi:guanine nucleotide binding protein, alpha subunit [Globomyces pollinis-pini]|nr:guanine nucleotide binding protein, alpha subunit [Globomyces pollinis-pini]